MNNQDLENRFSYHAPTPEAIPKFNRLRDTIKALSYLIDGLCPQSREKSLALTNLEEVMFWANASIARTCPIEKRDE